ncbi:MAG: glycosyltransferase family 2 protein [Flavobacteriales bacterium]
MQLQPFISVIIPTYNRGSLIRHSILSVLNQDYPNYEIIVVDDGSSDHTREVINEFFNTKIRYFYIDNSERGAARNFGAKQSKGEYVTFLDSDDIMYPHYLSEAVRLVNCHNAPVFMHLAYELRYEFGKIKRKVNYLKNNDIFQLIKGNPFGCIGIVIRRDVFLEYRFMETKEIFSSEDWALWLRVSARHGIIVSNRISAGALIHRGRSALNVSSEKIEKTKLISMNNAFTDENVVKVFGKYRKKMEAYSETFTALFLMIAKERKLALRHFFNAVRLYPLCLFELRTLVIARYFIKWK